MNRYSVTPEAAAAALVLIGMGAVEEVGAIIRSSERMAPVGALCCIAADLLPRALALISAEKNG